MIILICNGLVMVITLVPVIPGSSPYRGVAQRKRDRLITYRSLDRNQPSRNKRSDISVKFLMVTLGRYT